MSIDVSLKEVRARLDALADEKYSPASRRAASDWATPMLIQAGTPPDVEDPRLGRALFLLGAADLIGEADGAFVYGPADFEAVRAELEAGGETND